MRNKKNTPAQQIYQAGGSKSSAVLEIFNLPLLRPPPPPPDRLSGGNA